MFQLADEGGQHLALKPVSCPGHIQLVQRRVPSYRELPLRLGEFGLVHRSEPSGSLHGLFRLRQFAQDDGHIFCVEEQLREEVLRFCRSLKSFYADFGFEDVEVAFSSRPAQRAGSDAVWDVAEALLLEAAQGAGLHCRMQAGQGAFYGPKLEFVLKDRLGRDWQCGTIQLDLVLPERFDLSYVDASGQKRRPMMLHRAMLGSLERFIAILLEHHEGSLPAWLAPEQVVVASIGDGAVDYAERFAAKLREAGCRAHADVRAESLSRKIVDAHQVGAPCLVVVGNREVEKNAVRIRRRDGEQQDLPWDQAVTRLVAGCQPSLAGLLLQPLPVQTRQHPGEHEDGERVHENEPRDEPDRERSAR